MCFRVESGTEVGLCFRVESGTEVGLWDLFQGRVRY